MRSGNKDAIQRNSWRLRARPARFEAEGAREAVSCIDERQGRTTQQAAPSDVTDQLGHLITRKMPLPCSILQTTSQPPDERGFQQQHPSLVIQLKTCEYLLWCVSPNLGALQASSVQAHLHSLQCSYNLRAVAAHRTDTVHIDPEANGIPRHQKVTGDDP